MGMMDLESWARKSHWSRSIQNPTQLQDEEKKKKIDNRKRQEINKIAIPEFKISYAVRFKLQKGNKNINSRNWNAKIKRITISRI